MAVLRRKTEQEGKGFEVLSEPHDELEAGADRLRPTEVCGREAVAGARADPQGGVGGAEFRYAGAR